MSVPASAEPNAQGTVPEAPSTGQAGVAQAQEQRADPTQVSGAGTQEQTTRTPDYVRDAFARLRGYTQNVQASAPAPTAPGNAPEPATQTPPASRTPAREAGRSATPSTGPATTFPPAQTPPSTRQGQGRQNQQAPQDSQIVLTPEEYQRRIQSEADRILAKQRRDDETRNAQEQERELRRTNPFEYARLMESKEQELEASRAETTRLSGIVGTQLQYYDRAVLDTFVGALPEHERQHVIAPDGDGIENRKATAANTLKALRTRWVAEGRASAREVLMKDQTFIKEILARYGQAAPEAPTSPAYARASPGAGGNASGLSDESARMGAFIRAGASAART